MSKKSRSNKETSPVIEPLETEVRASNNLDKEVVLEVEKEEVEEFSEDDFIVPETQPTTEPTMEEEFNESIKPKKNIMRKRINYWCFIILALVGGFFGLQEFYRGNVGLGILAVLFCWTCIPAYRAV